MDEKEFQVLVEELALLPKETEWVEFKVNNSNPQEIGEYISALSNSACLHNKKYAYLVFGIQDGTHQIVGTNFNPYEEKIKSQELENWIATQLNPRIDFYIYEGIVKGKKIVIFLIEATISTPVKFKGIEYIRVGSYKKPLFEHPEKARKIWTKTVEIPFENQKAKIDLSDDTVLSLIDYSAYFDMIGINLPQNKEKILDKLVEEKLIIKRYDSYDITNLGAILFAKDINNFESLSRKAIRVIQYQGNNRLNTLKEQIGRKGYGNGFEGLITFINALLPSNEEVQKALREEVKVYPEIAIRELVANTIIHQDFNIKGTSPMIEIFYNRIEITNSGKPLINTLRFIDHSPESRNEKLAGFMRRLGICEERGSGIDKVIALCEIFQLPAPEFIEGDNYTRVILFAPKTLHQMDRQDKIRACYQHCCLRYVSGEKMTNQTIRERFKIEDHNAATASRIIADTIKEELIRDDDENSKSRKFAKYVPFWS